MHWKSTAILYFPTPFALLWLAFAAAEARRLLIAIRGGQK